MDDFKQNRDDDAQNRLDEETKPEPPLRYNETNHVELAELVHEEDNADGSTPENTFDRATAKELSSAGKFALAAAVAGPVSLFIGGTLLSTVGLILAIMAFRKMKRAEQAIGLVPAVAAVRRTSILAIAVCAIALTVNVIYMILWFPVIMEAVSSGEYGQLLGGTPSTGGSGTSTWG